MEALGNMYRFQEINFSENRLMLIRHSFPIIKRTQCGVWIDEYGKKRFINLQAKKRYACPTFEEALESYHARKRRQIRILKHQLEKAEAALKLTEDNSSEYFGLGDY